MSVVFTDSFTVGADANIDAYPATPDYAYTLGSGTNLTVNAANDRVQKVDTATDRCARIINGAVPTGDQEITATGFAASGTDDHGGLAARIKTDGTSNFYAGYRYLPGTHADIYRVTAGPTFTNIAAQTSTAAGAQTLVFKATGAGATVALSWKVGAEAALTFNDTNAARHVSGVPGIYMYGATANVPWVDDVSVDNLAAAGGVTYPQLERGIRGLERGVYAGAP